LKSSISCLIAYREKVINLISLLFAPVIITLKDKGIYQIANTDIKIPLLSVVLSIILVVIIGGAIMFSKREIKELVPEAPDKQ
jgi:FtsH-binding integral membrane protein